MSSTPSAPVSPPVSGTATAPSSDPNFLPSELPSGLNLSLYYLFFLGAGGMLTSYLSLGLLEQGLSVAELSGLLVLPPLVRILAPTLWGYLADRYQITGVLLRVCSWGAVLAYLPILTWQPLAVGVAMAGLSFFRVAAVVLTDALIFRRVAAGLGSFGGIRMWGTLGYVLVTLGGGYLSEAIGAARAVNWGLALMVVAALLTHRLPRPSRAPRPVVGAALRALLHRRSFVLFLLATALHALGQTTYDTFIPVHLERLGISHHLIGWCVGLGASVEVGVMAYSRHLLKRFDARHMVMFGSAVAVLRWALTAWVSTAWILIAIQALHGLTFGVWYVAAASWVDREAPPELRASAQALLAMFSFGLGSVLAMGVGATVGQSLGTSAQFWMASLAAAAAFGLCWWSGRTGGEVERKMG